MVKYFLFTGPLDHMAHFKKYGFVQQYFKHKNRLEKLSVGDYVVFYASRLKHDSKEPYQKFMAIGKITDNKITTVEKRGVKYHRMKAKFYKFDEVPLSQKINKLDFLKNKKYYGLFFISGFRELSKHDFDVIKSKN